MVPGAVEVEQLGRSLWLLHGEHDLSALPVIDGAFQRIAESGTTVIVDVRNATFIDSTLIGAIVMQARRGETVLLVAPERGSVRRVLDLVGISSSVEVFETRQEALRVASAGEPG